MHGLHIQSRFVESVCQQDVAGAMLVVHSPVTWLSGNKDNLCFVRSSPSATPKKTRAVWESCCIAVAFDVPEGAGIVLILSICRNLSKHALCSSVVIHDQIQHGGHSEAEQSGNRHLETSGV